MNSLTRIEVGGPAPYDVLVGTGLRASVVDLVGAAARRVAVVHPAAVRLTAVEVGTALDAAGFEVLPVEVPDGEPAKTVEVAASCWAALGRAGFTRSDAVVGVGGGATTDVAGFVAATWLRGVRLVNVPTTLLGMVDAAVGGKTGINTEQGKNLVGAFHPPVAVVCDLDLLKTLPEHDFRAGLAEVVKVGLTSDPVILDLVEADPVDVRRPSGRHVRELVERAIRVKAAVVSEDLREALGGALPGGLGREVLNYGHTFGHAVEQVEQFRWRHGEAVSVGLVYAAELAHLAGRLPAADVRRHRALLSALGLPTSYRADRWAPLHAAMRVDKKARGDTLRFVVLARIGQPTLLEGPTTEQLQAAYEEVSA